MGISQERLAQEIGLSFQVINEVIGRRRPVTAEIDLRLCRLFGLSNGYWLRAQAAYDTEVAQEKSAGVLGKITPWQAG